MAALSGRVTYAGWHDGGFGYLVVVAHGRGVRTWYAHLAQIDVRRGQPVRTGTPVGQVGATGATTALTFTSRSTTAARPSTR